MKMKLAVYLLSLFITLASGIAWSQESPQLDCSNAKEDIAHLKHEKKSTDERAVKGVMGILPIGLVVNAVGSTTKHDPKEEMEIKQYNQKITDRINEIEANCKDQLSKSVLDTSTN